MNVRRSPPRITPRALLKRFGFSVEEYDGKPQQEIEFTIYAKLPNFDQVISMATNVEKHEQWDLPVDKPDVLDGRVRLRAINGSRYTMTTKIKRGSFSGFEEVNATIPEGLYNHLTEFCKRGFNKTRYDIPLDGSALKWEVDVFLCQSGAPHPWVKIDLEVDSLDMRLPDLPFEVEDCFFADEPDLSNEHRRLLETLWNVEWCPISPKHE